MGVITKLHLFCICLNVPGFCGKEHLSRPLLEDAQQAPWLLVTPKIQTKEGQKSKRNQILKELKRIVIHK